MIKQFHPFYRTAIIQCEMTNQTFEALFDQQLEKDYYVKSKMRTTRIKLREAIVSAVSANDVLINYDAPTKQMALEISPAPRGYVIFAFVPIISFLHYFNGLQIPFELLLFSSCFIFFLCILFYYKVRKTQKEIIGIIGRILSKKGIKYRVINPKYVS